MARGGTWPQNPSVGATHRKAPCDGGVGSPMVAQGASQKAIGEVLGVHHSTISWRMKHKLNLEPAQKCQKLTEAEREARKERARVARKAAYQREVDDKKAAVLGSHAEGHGRWPRDGLELAAC